MKTMLLFSARWLSALVLFPPTGLLAAPSPAEESRIVRGSDRFEVSVGRDLVVEPAPASSPLNFLVYPHLESQGEPKSTKNEFHFRRIKEISG